MDAQQVIAAPEREDVLVRLIVSDVDRRFAPKAEAHRMLFIRTLGALSVASHSGDR